MARGCTPVQPAAMAPGAILHRAAGAAAPTALQSARSSAALPVMSGATMTSSFRQIINRAVRDRRILVVPGAHDALSARLIQHTGFETDFVGGFPVAGARYGPPGLGLMRSGGISAAARDVLGASRLPASARADEGSAPVK